MSFKPPAGVSGWDLPHLKIRATVSRIIQDGLSDFEMCWQMGSCNSGCGRGQQEVLEADAVGQEGSWRLGVFGVVVGSWRPVVVSRFGVPVIGCSQLVLGSWWQGAVSQCEGPRGRE